MQVNYYKTTPTSKIDLIRNSSFEDKTIQYLAGLTAIAILTIAILGSVGVLLPSVAGASGGGLLGLLALLYTCQSGYSAEKSLSEHSRE